MGPSRTLTSVLILRGASSPWGGLSSYSIVGLSRTLSCKLLFFSCNWSNVNFISSSQGPGMAGPVRMLNLNWNGLNFLSLLASCPTYLAPSPFPRAPKRAIANNLSVVSCVGQQAQWFGIRKPGVRASQLCSRIRDSMLQTYSLRLSWQLTLYIENLSFVLKRWEASQSVFSLPIWLLRFQSETYFLLIRIIYHYP